MVIVTIFTTKKINNREDFEPFLHKENSVACCMAKSEGEPMSNPADEQWPREHGPKSEVNICSSFAESAIINDMPINLIY